MLFSISCNWDWSCKKLALAFNSGYASATANRLFRVSLNTFSASAISPGVVAFIAMDLASVTFSKTPLSWEAYPFTVSTRLGTRSYRFLHWTSISDHEDFTVFLSRTSLFWVAITAMTRTAMMIRMTIRVIFLLLSSDNAVDYRISRIFA